MTPLHPHSPAPRRLGGARGQVLPALCVTIFAVIAAVALAVDISGALRARAAETQTLELAKEDLMASANFIKFSDRPAYDSADLVGEALQEDGYRGTATVIYYELPASDIPDGRSRTDRYAVTYVSVGADYQTAFGWVFGRSRIRIGNDIAWTMNPYSTTTVWRPADAMSMRYTVTVTDHGYTVADGVEVTGTAGLPQKARELAEHPTLTD